MSKTFEFSVGSPSPEDERLEHTVIPWRWMVQMIFLSIFSWVMAVGEPAVHLPGCSCIQPVFQSPRINLTTQKIPKKTGDRFGIPTSQVFLWSLDSGYGLIRWKYAIQPNILETFHNTPVWIFNQKLHSSEETLPGNQRIPPKKGDFWVDDFPNFPFGGICDRFLEGRYPFNYPIQESGSIWWPPVIINLMSHRRRNVSVLQARKETESMMQDDDDDDDDNNNDNDNNNNDYSNFSRFYSYASVLLSWWLWLYIINFTLLLALYPYCDDCYDHDNWHSCDDHEDDEGPRRR